MNNSYPQLKKVTAEEFLKDKPLTLSKDVYSGYNIPYSYLVSLLEEYAKVYYGEQINEVMKELPTAEYEDAQENGMLTKEQSEIWRDGYRHLLKYALPLLSAKNVRMSEKQSEIEKYHDTVQRMATRMQEMGTELIEKDKEIERLSVLLGYLNRQ